MLNYFLFKHCDEPIQNMGACIHDYYYGEENGSIWFDVSLKTSTGLDVNLIYKGYADKSGLVDSGWWCGYPVEIKPWNPLKNDYSETGYLFGLNDELDSVITAVLNIFNDAVIDYFDK